MSLEIVYGEPRHRVTAIHLSDVLRDADADGTVYLGYPVLATADERVYVDALLVSPSHGLVAFQIADGIPTSDEEWVPYISEQDKLYSVLTSHLGRHDQLRKGRGLAVEVETVTVFPGSIDSPPPATEGRYCSLEEVGDLVHSFDGLNADTIKALQAALQRVTTIKPAKRRAHAVNKGSRGSILKEIEKGIANLDRYQKRAAIETPEGPQRIRGLAGSGKTIVLALKAAYLHAQHPDWRIAVCFMSRSLYQQFEDLITRFTFEHSNDRPDFEHLQILHAWGAANRDGMYKTIASEMGAQFRNWNYAVATHGRDEGFAGVCQELLEIANATSEPPIFDAVLIDEAQDLPSSFFKLVYRFTKNPKRLVWAYDELQNLSEEAMPATEELFGTTSSGAEPVNLTNTPGEARRDIVLPVCYRNSPWALATAHALGFGIYRDGGLVQHFEDLDLWTKIGYSVVSGKLEFGRRVELVRSSASSPEYFPQLLEADDAVAVHKFATQREQDVWAAEQIRKNLEEDELDPDDILVVLPDAYTSKNRASKFSRALARLDIDSHLVGVGSSVDQVFLSDSVAIAHIFRAKGNEAPMVYVLDAQYAAADHSLVSRRNILFTAITRSRAWVRICGAGERMDLIAKEAEKVHAEAYHLRYTIPNRTALAKIRRIHRELSNEEMASIRRATRTLSDVLAAFERGVLDLEDVPPELRTRLLAALTQHDTDEFDF